MKCIAAVSGGPDSMALLSWMEERNLDYAVCHVNYHHRPSAGRDEAIVRNWCAAHEKALYILHPEYECRNFQGWAREVRYAFFEAIARMLGAKEIYLGHHLDDAIETWMLQKQRGAQSVQIGLCERAPFGDFTLVRPLLGFEKRDLQKICEEKGIAFGIDESNASDEYARNRLRKQVIAPAATLQKLAWKEEMEKEQRAWNKEKARIAALAAKRSASVFFDEKDGPAVLDALIYEKTKQHLSGKHLQDLLEKLRAGKEVSFGSLKMQIADDRLLLRDHEPVPFYIGSNEQLESLCQNEYSFECFRLCRHGKKIESFMVKPEDFPLVIRPPKEGDAIEMRFGSKKISRLHIDRKIPKIERPLSLVIEGAKGLIFAWNAGCAADRYADIAPLFMVRLSV